MTGASSGIGRAVALALDGAGWMVWAGVRREEDAADLRAAASGRLEPISLDVTDASQMEAASAAVGGRLDALVNNAGYALPGPLESLPPAALRRQFEVNVVGQVALTQAMLPALRNVKGRIVFISSISGRVVIPLLAAYAASKHALEAIGDGFRRELSPWGISVSLVEPGPIKSGIWEIARSFSGDEEGVDPGRAALYAKQVERLREGSSKAEAAADGPAVVVAAVRHALESPRPKTRYVVGKGVALRVAIARLLPDRWLDRRLGARSRR